ncbi:simple sugar transport system permease protein [Thermanaeromonas toyohensis ToBE]|uniref:Simple sugar transport system permease protein n=1 Tax=Thermanaeromonas toyohensis ToBE TaxID=698762 RepID=A0A1W1VIR6_9FIRM|nr:ABC transporter permease [Thermanaeromonas toyohensis]SMB93252.1 simple sugar transport system permease protein [Thermanaeromonas toyohensis ToBE]
MNNQIAKSWFVQVLILLGALVGALLIGAILLILAGSDPIKAYSVMFTGPIGSEFGLTETLVRATPLLLVGLGIVISFRSGILNIGGEGQILMGAITASAVALSLPGWPKVILLPLVLLASCVAGGIWGGIAGWLKARLSVNEILSTVMLNQIALQFYLYLIRGPLIDPQEVAYGTGVPQTAMVPEQVWLTRLVPGMRLHTGFILALILAIVVYIFLWRTTIGYRMRAVGAGPEASRYGGIRVEFYLILAIALAGAFAGLAGAVEVLGVHHRALESLSAGYGFSGIVAALFGRLHPLGTIPAAILLGALILGADMMQRAVNVPAAIVMAIQGLVILFVVSSDLLLRKPELLTRIFTRYIFTRIKQTKEAGTGV